VAGLKIAAANELWAPRSQIHISENNNVFFILPSIVFLKYLYTMLVSTNRARDRAIFLNMMYMTDHDRGIEELGRLCLPD